MDQVTGMDHLDTMSEGELDVLERQIAGIPEANVRTLWRRRPDHP